MRLRAASYAWSDNDARTASLLSAGAAIGWKTPVQNVTFVIDNTINYRSFENFPGGRADTYVVIAPSIRWTPFATAAVLALGASMTNQQSNVVAARNENWSIGPLVTMTMKLGETPR